eukprot:CAMPEP_0114534340 /NCGR_PEP_ID=MMETSP0109-20121206/27783_1 /TAXON_ID=29199 /ORGANISM="Chlorarachnion reptans, Strain CCCM449" /LENGTH=83 /DNA_ID=CAMNT_0001717737 /DNA_START=416 /DNA_END=665 /DNA_ORIENTATION=-
MRTHGSVDGSMDLRDGDDGGADLVPPQLRQPLRQAVLVGEGPGPPDDAALATSSLTPSILRQRNIPGGGGPGPPPAAPAAPAA